MTNHWHEAFARAAPMNIPVAAAHWAKGRAKVSADGIEDRLTKSQPARTIANQRRKDIAPSQCHSSGGAKGLLASAKKNPSVNFAHAIKAREFIIQNSRQKHQAIRFEVRTAS